MLFLRYLLNSVLRFPKNSNFVNQVAINYKSEKNSNLVIWKEQYLIKRV